jgi:hypothetical protein
VFPDAIELEHILTDAFEADSNITERQLRSLLRRALRTCRRNGPIKAEGLLTEARRLAQSELSESKKQFTIWTKFRARQMAFSKGFRVRWNDVWLEATNNLPRKFHLQEYFFNGHGRIYPEKPSFYGYLIGRCEARTEEQAVERILDATDVFMAVFNIYQLRDGAFDIGKPRAEGKLWHGPYHFVFGNDVFLGKEHIWFDAEFDAEGWETFPADMKNVVKQLPAVRRALKALTNHPLRKVLLKTLHLMQNAMSSRDERYNLLRYWSALEQLYGEENPVEKNYSRIIQRASFAETDKNIARWKLSHIARLRNEYVHAGDGSNDIRIMSKYLRGLLARHFHFILFYSDVRSHREWLDFCDLPSDLNLLENRKSLIEQRMGLIKNDYRTRKKR